MYFIKKLGGNKCTPRKESPKKKKREIKYSVKRVSQSNDDLSTLLTPLFFKKKKEKKKTPQTVSSPNVWICVSFCYLRLTLAWLLLLVVITPTRKSSDALPWDYTIHPFSKSFIQHLKNDFLGAPSVITCTAYPWKNSHTILLHLRCRRAHQSEGGKI